MKKSINRNGQTPIYEQIYQNLRSKIDNTEFSAGEAFPSERELAETFGVSRMTVRQALNSLKKDGLIYHERGIGAFVSKRKLDVHTRNLVGFTEEMQALGLKPSSKLVLIKREIADEETANDLRIDIGEEVIHLQRLRLADDSPMAVEDAFLPANRYPNLDKFDLENVSLYEVLEQEYGVKMKEADEILEAVSLDKSMAKILSVKEHSPALLLHRVVFSEGNLAVESVKTYYRADRYRATFKLEKEKK
jgi:GntR family transcriptional regulator